MKKNISFAADKEDLQLIDSLKHLEKRRTYSDLIRFLIRERAEKFLQKNIVIKTEKETTALQHHRYPSHD